MKPFKSILALGLLYCVMVNANDASAEDPRPHHPRNSWYVFLDNDAFAPDDEDQDYTGGLSVVRTGDSLEHSLLFLEGGLTKLNHIFSNHETVKDETIARSAEVGFEAFTPANIKTSDPVFDDRPYASLFFYSQSRTTVADTESPSLSSVTLTLGFLGLDLIKDVQDLIHKVTDNNRPQGWDNQISSGGEPTARLGIYHQQPWLDGQPSRKFNGELSYVYKVNAGYLTDGSVGAAVRFGRLRSPWWSFAPLRQEYAEKTPLNSPGKASNSTEWFFWASGLARLRIYNAFLQGQFRDSIVTFSSDDLRHLLGELQLGFTFHHRSGWQWGYTWNYQSSEFKHEPADRSVTWGTLYIAWQF